ncbi:hypothetical protein IW146_002550 [Coemansia sp. RSA 922]|nr:hypothetical protein LPJ71_006170 [Coemansia sp. S17]KAJ2034795.1 hypothetical protein H4S03_004740 [Coemansia sp. S3946]KAJ2073457.1 hypothetical protein GGH13_001990 [Coemansia sp. S155-1]KAJ2115120.1 hypothetical protein IW146_002550 [Coemansia sp. RSA 922]
MGKRKSSRKVVKKEQPKLDTTFDCLFCNHEKSIVVAMDKKNRVGNLKCKICSATYQAALNHLSDPIDVYSEWIDACEEAKRKETVSIRASTTTTGAAASGSGRSRQEPAANGRRSADTAAVDNYDDDEDDEDDGYYDDVGRGRQREVNRPPVQLTDESDIDDF